MLTNECKNDLQLRIDTDDSIDISEKEHFNLCIKD